MGKLAPELWPLVAILGVIAVALLARWLRSAAVEDPGDESQDALDDEALADEREAEGSDDLEPAELELDDYDDEDDVAPLGVAAEDRQEFLQRLADDGAITLVWCPIVDPIQPGAQSVVQHNHADGTATMPVFTSERKAFAYLQVLGPKAVADVASYETWRVDAAFLIQGEFEVVVNPGSPFETALSTEDRNTVAAIAGVEEREPVDSSLLGEDDSLGDDDDASGEDSDNAPTGT